MEEEGNVKVVEQRTYPLLKKNAIMKAVSRSAGFAIGTCVVAAACGYRSQVLSKKLIPIILTDIALDVIKLSIEKRRDDKKITLESAGTSMAMGILSGAAIMSATVMLVTFLKRGAKEDG